MFVFLQVKSGTHVLLCSLVWKTNKFHPDALMLCHFVVVVSANRDFKHLISYIETLCEDEML